MPECIQAETGTLECSDDALPLVPAAGMTLAETVIDYMCNTAVYNEIEGLKDSLSMTPANNEVVTPLMDFAGAEARCITSKKFSITFSGLPCEGTAGYDCLLQHAINCTEAFWRYRWVGVGTGLPELLMVAQVQFNTAGAPRGLAEYSATLNSRLEKYQLQA